MAYELQLTLDIQRAVALAGRHHVDAVDVDMRRQGGDPVGGVGDVLGGQRVVPS
jgi:hypothetical protein